MGSLWFGMAIMLCAAVVCATAVPAARGSGKKHPLVMRSSAAAAWWFSIAALAYVVAFALLLTSLPLWVAIACAFVGLFTSAGGYVAAGGASK
ncbi:hypothetical protein G7Y31_01360 [Corynebacterium lizhenjunii]|uniref:Uncharacterized protein n=1 Tax=Corynebacterium lizhenjunii TaxID=2709394 RepID=A0A7T0PC73_9CORY|nr:hypothetical protein [Corynebacterium lizhenjunii]QPK79397.1 hypothetical protein G7Y31_01360 [Corynebacterium lizhenjunii]